MRERTVGALEGTSGTGLDWLIGSAFWTLGVLCLLNVNDLLRMWIGLERAFSPLILVGCLAALAGLLRCEPRAALGLPGALILMTLVSYGGIGMLVGVATGTALEANATWYLTRHVSSLLLILAVAVGARVAWQRIGGERVLLGVLLILTASCALMLASPWLREVLQSPPMDGAYRFFGTFSDPNEAGLVACFTVAAALALIRSGRYRILAYGSLMVALTALIGTFSRTALVVLPALAAGAMLLARGAQRRRLAGAGALIVLSMAGVRVGLDMTLFEDRQLERLNSLREIVEVSTIGDLPLAGRVTLWRLAGDRALESPVFGNGLGTSHALEGAWYNTEGVLLGAHNQYLILVGEAGFLPLLLFAGFLAAALAAGFRFERASWALGTVSGWALVLTLFSFAFHGLLTQRATNFIIGLSCAVVASCIRGDETHSPQELVP